MPFDALEPYTALLQTLGTSPTRARLFSVRRSFLLPPSVPSSEQPFYWPVSDQDSAPYA